MKTIYRTQAADGTYLQNIKWGDPRFGGRGNRNFNGTSAVSNHISVLSTQDRKAYAAVGAKVVELQLVEQPVRTIEIDEWLNQMNERREKRNGR